MRNAALRIMQIVSFVNLFFTDKDCFVELNYLIYSEERKKKIDKIKQNFILENARIYRIFSCVPRGLFSSTYDH